MDKNINIVLIGITGVGKTTVGRALADNLGKEFYDLDKNIEQHCGVDIPTIFEIEGEAGFRTRETDELRRIIDNKYGFVLSVGGGCITRMENRTILTNGPNVVIQLYADIDILVERLSKSIARRPLFNNVDIGNKVAELYRSRKDYYDSITDFKINTSMLKQPQVILEITAYLKKAHIQRSSK
ncbi:MAG: shikimate kinase [Pseudomonadota bacterium]|nr:shikimate kinase [Pseudomonadota bacterium]